MRVVKILYKNIAIFAEEILGIILLVLLMIFVLFCKRFCCFGIIIYKTKTIN